MGKRGGKGAQGRGDAAVECWVILLEAERGVSLRRPVLAGVILRPILEAFETAEEVGWKERKRLRALLVSPAVAKRSKGERAGEGERLVGKGIRAHPDLREVTAVAGPYFQLFSPALKLRLEERYMTSVRVKV